MVAFQPHRYTRTRDLWDEFVSAFNDADVLVLTEIYAAGEDKILGVEAAPLADAVRAHGHRDVHFAPDLAQVQACLLELVAPGDLVVTLGAGSISTLACALARAPRGARLVIPHAARAELEEALGDRVRFDAPLARHTSLRVGGPADALATPADRGDLARLLAICARYRLPHLALGAGFNTLALDAGVEGVVIQLGRLRRLEERPGGTLRAEAGVSHNQLVKFCIRHGFSGLEFGAGIPGTVGGWIAMNAGIPSREVQHVVRELEVMAPTRPRHPPSRARGPALRVPRPARARTGLADPLRAARRELRDTREREGGGRSACSPGAPSRSRSTCPPAARSSRIRRATTPVA